MNALEYKREVERLFMSEYGIEMSDITNEARVERARLDGELPGNFVEWLARKYDLIKNISYGDAVRLMRDFGEGFTSDAA